VSGINEYSELPIIRAVLGDAAWDIDINNEYRNMESKYFIKRGLSKPNN